MIHSVDHINIVVSDLTRSVHFYESVLGFIPTETGVLSGEWIEKVVGLSGVEATVTFMEAPGGGPRIELLCYASPEGDLCPQNSLPNTIGLRHIAFQVENMEQAVSRLKKYHVEFVGAAVTVPDIVISHDKRRKQLCYFKDPDGTILEVACYGKDGDGPE